MFSGQDIPIIIIKLSHFMMGMPTVVRRYLIVDLIVDPNPTPSLPLALWKYITLKTIDFVFYYWGICQLELR